MFAKQRYFPRNLSMSSRHGDRVYEFLVVWKYELGSMARVTETFAEHHAKVLLTHSQLDEESDEVVATFYCDLVRADAPVEAVKRDIAGLPFVRGVEYVSTESSLFDKFLFPVTIWGRNRVLVMRLSPLLNIEKRLDQELGSAGGAIMFREGEAYATETLGQYRAALGPVRPEVLLENVKDGLRATGWGLFEFRQTREGYDVGIKETVVPEGATEPSRFLCGIVAGIVESVHGVKVKVVDSRVDPKTGTASVRLSKIADFAA